MKNYSVETKKIVRVFISESDRWEGKPLYLAIIDLCREKGIGGATVLRGIAGYGLHGKVHTDKILALSGDLPLIIEIISSEDEAARLMPVLGGMLNGGLITIDDTSVVRKGKAQ